MSAESPINELAKRAVNAVIATMVLAAAVATAVGFWLSYSGLHDFALRAGLHGAEAWAWPSSIDLFVICGEAGVTIAALRRHTDRAAWAYLIAGFGASVVANVLHVDPGALRWAVYAVAAVPPIAAMLALAALLRQVYALAESRVVTPETASNEPEPVTAARELVLKAFTEAASSSGAVPGIREIRRDLSCSQDRAVQVHKDLTAVAAARSNGHTPALGNDTP